MFIEGCLEKLLEHFVIVHQTGDAKQFGDFDRLSRKQETLPSSLKERYYLRKFVHHDELGLILKEATFVISRSGINTVSELLMFQKPSLLIPLPFSQKNEQLKNALYLKKAGLAEVAEQDSLTPEALFELVMTMQKNKSAYGVRKEILATIKKDAAAEILNIVYDLAKKTNP
jgi:UDP-N-acetylglucosamine--N-acetylmuramyl-(pentapeptide) pyrophosphoryl-undecaprenol N-acetylglucosamine transferase